jgi:MFS family permease
VPRLTDRTFFERDERANPVQSFRFSAKSGTKPMTTMAINHKRSGGMTKEERLVVFASALGTTFEWYDFYIYGVLAPILQKQFFSAVNPTAGFIFVLLAFAAGFAVRPFGALLFGRIGDLVGRKYTFLTTITLMGLGTFLIGLLPSYASVGIAAPVILVLLRLLQGLALGGEYGGAATYVAEHAPHGRRGAYTSWIQTTATVGLFVALLIILAIRTGQGEEAFADWGWRIPFLLSAVLLVVSIWIWLRLEESPVFRRMKAEGKGSKAPLTESFGNWSNGKIVLLALFGATAGEAVIWYGGQFYALFFLTQTLKVNGATANILIALSLLIGTPGFVLFGWLSDKIGRKPIMLAGFALGAVSYFTIFQGLTHYVNPALEKALATAPVSVIADPGECSFQFNPVGISQFRTSCDIAKSALVTRSANYENRSAPPGTVASVKIGDETIP